MVDINEYMDQFLEDLNENLENLDTGIIELERDKENLDIVNNIFRAVHTIKGLFGAMGLVNLEKLTHRLEDLLSKGRTGEMKINEKIIDILFVCHDIISNSVSTITENGSDEGMDFEPTIDRIKLLLNSSMETEAKDKDEDINDLSKQEKTTIKDAIKNENAIFRIHVIIDKDDDFALVRAFMAYKEFNEVYDIVKVIPNEEILINAAEESPQDVTILLYAKELDEKIINKVKKIEAVNDLIVEQLGSKKIKNELKIKLPKSVANSVLEDFDNDKKMEDELKIYIKLNLDKINSVIETIQNNNGEVDEKVLYELYRYFHSIRGLAGILEEEHILKLISQIEITLDKLRNLEKIENDYVNLLKFVPNIIETSYKDQLQDEEMVNQFIVKLENMSKDLEEKSKQNVKKLNDSKKNEKDEEDIEADEIIDDLLNEDSIDVIPEETKSADINEEFGKDFVLETSENLEDIEMLILKLERDSSNMSLVDEVYRDLHSIKGLAGFLNKNTIEQVAHKSENILTKIKNQELYVNKLFIDKILETIDIIKKLSENEDLNSDEKFMNKVNSHIEDLDVIENAKGEKIGEILKNELGLSDEDVESLVKKQQKEYKNMKLGEIAVKEKKAHAKDVVEALRKQDTPKQTQQKPQAKTYIRVDVEKVDTMVNMIGELMILHSQITQDDHMLTQEQRSKSLRMGKLVKTLQNDSMSLRMVSLKQTFQKVLRVARKAKQDLGKQIDVEVLGEDTEIDRNIAERILDPLSHMVKNSISHGIESNTEERINKGKTAVGNISLSAYSKKGNVFIEIADDGRGMDPQKIYEKAIEKNLIDKNRSYSNEEIYTFIFLPGFSTQENINEISGRGVGMDVVRTEISGAGGKVDIDTAIDKGTTFTLKIPINLAALNGTMIKLKNEIFVIPTIFIKEIIRETDEHKIEVAGKQTMVKVRNSLIPLIKRENYFNVSKNYDDDEIIVILETENRTKALKVSEVLGRKEVVVKPLGEELNHLEFVSGATILGDGSVSLILDVDFLLKGTLER